MIRYRIQYQKTQAMRYTSNLDVHKVWERALRRARLPLAYSQGFHPQPRINQACPLPLGILSECELIDIWLESDVEADAVAAQIAPVMAPGIKVNSIHTVELSGASLPTLVTSATYRVEFIDGAPNDLEDRVNAILQQETIQRVRRGKSYDLRPLIDELSAPTRDELVMTLAARSNQTGRPDEVLAAMNIDPAMTRVTRSSLNLIRG